MYQSHKVYVQEDMVFADLILENPSLMAVMEFFAIDDVLKDDTIDELCRKHNVNLPVFLVFANLYNGFIPHRNDINSESFDIRAIIRFLRNTHQFYIRDKYPKIKQYIKQLYEKQSKTEIERIDFFFNDYFDEVLEHLNYEDEVAFPYFCKLLGDDTEILDADFSVNEYREHHTDIETKLSDLKNLLIKHISLKGDFPLKRKIVKSLFELENDLTIHSTIEELILLPLVDELEKNKRCG
jgi:regulator of cell morphogenesis and NO signaling